MPIFENKMKKLSKTDSWIVKVNDQTLCELTCLLVASDVLNAGEKKKGSLWRKMRQPRRRLATRTGRRRRSTRSSSEAVNWSWAASVRRTTGCNTTAGEQSAWADRRAWLIRRPSVCRAGRVRRHGVVDCARTTATHSYRGRPPGWTNRLRIRWKGPRVAGPLTASCCSGRSISTTTVRPSRSCSNRAECIASWDSPTPTRRNRYGCPTTKRPSNVALRRTKWRGERINVIGHNNIVVYL